MNTTSTTTSSASTATLKAPISNVPATRPTEKVLDLIDTMDAKKVTAWLVKTARTLTNHFDSATRKRKCTNAYWDGLLLRYTRLTKRAKTLKVWNDYCTTSGRNTTHVATDIVASN